MFTYINHSFFLNFILCIFLIISHTDIFLFITVNPTLQRHRTHTVMSVPSNQWTKWLFRCFVTHRKEAIFRNIVNTARFFILIHTSVAQLFKASAAFEPMFTFDPITLIQTVLLSWEIVHRALLLTPQLHWSIRRCD